MGLFNNVDMSKQFLEFKPLFKTSTSTALSRAQRFAIPESSHYSYKLSTSVDLLNLSSTSTSLRSVYSQVAETTSSIRASSGDHLEDDTLTTFVRDLKTASAELSAMEAYSDYENLQVANTSLTRIIKDISNLQDPEIPAVDEAALEQDLVALETGLEGALAEVDALIDAETVSVGSVPIDLSRLVRVVELSNGGYASIQEQRLAGGDATELTLQIYDSQGLEQGDSILINSSTQGTQDGADVAVLADGSFVVAWTDTSGEDGDGSGIVAQRFDAAGVVTGSNFVLNTSTKGAQSDVHLTATNDGGFIAAWNDVHKGLISAQRFDGEGGRIGVEMNTDLKGQHGNISVKELENGGFVISYSLQSRVSHLQEWSDRGLGFLERLVSSLGKLLGEELGSLRERVELGAKEGKLGRISSHAMQALARLRDRASHYDVYAATFDADGEQIHGSVKINRGHLRAINDISLVALDDGGAAVAYTGEATFRRTQTAYGILETDGGLQSHTNIASRVRTSEIELAQLGNGHLVFAYTDQSDHNVYRDVYDLNHKQLGSTLQVNTASLTDSGKLSLEELSDGSFVIAYDLSLSSLEKGAAARRLDSTANTLSDEILLRDTANGDVSQVVVSDLGDGEFSLAFAAADQASGDSTIELQKYNAHNERVFDTMTAIHAHGSMHWFEDIRTQLLAIDSELEAADNGVESRSLAEAAYNRLLNALGDLEHVSVNTEHEDLLQAVRDDITSLKDSLADYVAVSPYSDAEKLKQMESIAGRLDTVMQLLNSQVRVAHHQAVSYKLPASAGVRGGKSPQFADSFRIAAQKMRNWSNEMKIGPDLFSRANGSLAVHLDATGFLENLDVEQMEGSSAIDFIRERHLGNQELFQRSAEKAGEKHSEDNAHFNYKA